MSSKSKKKKPREVSLNKAITIAMVIFVWAWVSIFEPSQEDYVRLTDEIRNIRESVATQRLNIREVKQELEDTYNVTFAI